MIAALNAGKLTHKYTNLCQKFYSKNADAISKPNLIPVTLIPGDGTGPERIWAMCDVVKAANLPIKWEIMQLSERDPFISQPMNEVIESIRKNKLCIKGPIASVENEHPVPLNIELRQSLDAYFSLIHFKSLTPKIPAFFKDIDIVLIRESSEGEYSNVEHEVVPGAVENMKIVSRQKSERIARDALEYALKNGRKKISVVHKANIMKKTDGLFLQTAFDVQKSDSRYAGIEMNGLIVDNCAMQLLTNPHQFDLILTSNFYGNIIANILAAISGGPALMAGVLRNGQNIRIYESAVRKTFSEASGRNIANPIAEIQSLILMLDDLGMKKEANLLTKSLVDLLDKNKSAHTRDIGGNATTSDFTKLYLAEIERNS